MSTIFTRLDFDVAVEDGPLSFAPIDGTPSAVEGDISFDLTANMKGKTHFRAYGLNKNAPAVIALHGGPGIPSGYLVALTDLAPLMPVILYDQMGCGGSTRFPNTLGDTSLWTESLFVAELKNLLAVLEVKVYSIIGHSWGGMLGATFASEQPAGLQKLVIWSSPASIPLWLEAVNYLRLQLPEEDRDTLIKHELAGTTEDPAYQKSVHLFYDRYVIRMQPPPEECVKALGMLGEDPTVYFTMNGPNEFHIIGPLKDWSAVEYAKNINVPTLVANGEFDECRDTAIQPWLDLIPNVKWKKFQASSHMALWEEREAFIATLKEFLV